MKSEELQNWYFSENELNDKKSVSKGKDKHCKLSSAVCSKMLTHMITHCSYAVHVILFCRKEGVSLTPCPLKKIKKVKEINVSETDFTPWKCWRIPIPGQCLGMPQLAVFTGDGSLKREEGKERQTLTERRDSEWEGNTFLSPQKETCQTFYTKISSSDTNYWFYWLHTNKTCG